MSRTYCEREPLLKNISGDFATICEAAKTQTYTNQNVPSSMPGPLDITSSSRHGILAGIWLAQFLSALNLTLVPTMLPAISSDFNKSNQASWVGTSYLLATCAFTPLYGRISDAMGRKFASKSAIILSAIGILACSLSHSIEMLIAARFISGLGGGGIFTTSTIITSDMYNMRSCSYVQSIGGIFYGLGMGLGGPVGGLLTDLLGWRSAFFAQIPFFAISFSLVTYNLCYFTPQSKGCTRRILKRLDYWGTLILLGGVASFLFFLSMKYNEGREWSDPCVWASLLAACTLTCLFLSVELFFSIEPILPPFLLVQKIPFLIGASNALVAVCNLSVSYYLPTWFQTVMLSSASTAGLHLLPNSICISTGSFFAGWMMHRTGKYKALNLIFGILPFISAVLLTRLREDSGQAHSWLTIMPLGFGNAVVLQTMYIAMVSNLPNQYMAVGTGFVQLLRGLGQVGGLAAASAVFQTRLDAELRVRVHTPDAEQLIGQIRHSVRILGTLPPDIQRLARDAYASSLRSVFVLAACASLFAFLLRLPIPDRDLDSTVDAGSESLSEEESVSSIPEEIRDEENKVVRITRTRTS